MSNLTNDEQREADYFTGVEVGMEVAPEVAEMERLRAEVERLRADRLAWAEAGAKAMRDDILQRATGAWTLRFDTAGYHSQMDVDARPIIEMIASADPAEVARRALDAEGGG